MRKWINWALFAVIVASFVSLAHAINYMYYSDTELTVYGDHVHFWHMDTLAGPVRSNDAIAIMQDPHFTDFFISSAADFWYGMAFNPHLDVPPIFNAPRLELPQTAAQFRQWALDQGHFFSPGPGMEARLEILGDSLRIWWRQSGLPFDTLQYFYYSLPESAVVFFDCPMSVFGTVSTNLILGAGGTIGLEDNVLYVSADPLTGIAPAGHGERLVMIAEGDIKVLNTVANGRENSSGAGYNQTNQDMTSIVLDGIYIALNRTFTFAQQNDPDSGYVCNCIPDDRGTIHLFGSVIQKQRGYVHRTTRSSTGYLKQYRYDNTLRHWNFGLWNVRENAVQPSDVNFGDVPLNRSASVIVRVYNDYVPANVTNITVGQPFTCTMSRDTYLFEHQIPVMFTAADTGTFVDSLRFDIPYYNKHVSVPLRARVPRPSSAISILPPSSFILSAFPNPFNARTVVRFELPQVCEASLDVFDITGRKIAALANGTLTSGPHEVNVDGSAWTAGIYFLRLSTPTYQRASKLVLIK